MVSRAPKRKLKNMAKRGWFVRLVCFPPNVEHRLHASYGLLYTHSDLDIYVAHQFSIFSILYVVADIFVQGTGMTSAAPAQTAELVPNRVR